MSSNRRSAVLATAVAAFVLAEALTAYLVGPLAGLRLSDLNDLLILSNATLGLALAVAGWPIAAHRPDIRIGWLLLGGGAAYAATGGGMALLTAVAAAGWQGDPPWRLLATLVSGSWTVALTFFLPMALLLFPDGRLPGPRWRWLVGVATITAPLFFATGVLSGFSGLAGVTGYFAVAEADAARFAWLTATTGAGVVITWLGTLTAMLSRFRRGDDRVRRQVLWVLLALLVVVILFTFDPLLPDSLLSIYPIALIPLAILIAVFRHQVLDIRLVFSRSLAYVLLTALTVGAYLAVVGVLGRVLTTQVPLGASVVSTVLVAAAFNPVRVWLQRRVDRAVYGARRDPVRAMAEVGAGAELDDMLRGLCTVLRLPSAAVVYRGTQLAGHGQAPEVLRTVPLLRGDERVGELVVGLRAGESRLDQADERILGLLAVPISVAVQATRLAADLGRSREQVITAREEERRRLRRDLHDGLGPVLTGIVLNAETALRLVRTHPGRSEELLGDLRDRTTGALDDIRRLVYELRPPALDSLGLVGALEEYAMMLSRRADGTPMTVAIDAPPLVGDLPAAVEVAAYRIVTEALTNVTRHSTAESAVVTLAVGDGRLDVSIHDDGATVAGGWQPGVGLTSIRERAAELGGRCVIQLDRTGGRIDVSLPIAAPATAHHGAPA